MATDYVAQMLNAAGVLADTGVDPAAKSLYDQLNKFLAGLTQAQRAQIAKRFVANMPSPNVTGLLGLQQGDLQNLAGFVQQVVGSGQTVPGAPQASDPPSASPSPSPAATTTAGGTATTTVGGVTTAQLAAGTQEPGSPWAANKLNTYTSPQVIGADQNNPDAVATALGIDAGKLKSEYDAYSANFQRAIARIGATSNPLLRSITGPQQPMSLSAFGEQMARAQDGVWQPAIDALSYTWQQQTGQPMPADLIQQVLTSLKALPANESNQVQTYMLSMVNQLASMWKGAAARTGQLDPASPSWNPQVAYQGFLQQLQTYAPTVYSGTAAAGGFSGSSVVGSYYTAHPQIGPAAAGEQGALQQAAAKVLTDFGVTPTPDLVSAVATSGHANDLSNYLAWAKGRVDITPDLIKQLMALPYGDPASASVQPGTGGAYLQSLPSSLKGVNWGQYQIAWGNLAPAWQAAFGRDPNPRELAWSIGKSTSDISDFVSNSPSAVDGVTIGQYNDYQLFITGLDKASGTTHAFSMGVDDSLIADLHKHLTSKATGQAHPAEMR